MIAQLQKNISLLVITFTLLLKLSVGLENQNSFSRNKLRAGQVQRSYQLWDPSKIGEKLLLWASLYPDLIRVTTAQKAYGLPTAGDVGDCPFDNVKGCLNYIYFLQDFKAYPEGSEASNRLPEVFWSGALHGDEQVGPTAVLEATILLLRATDCESHPKASHKAYSSSATWTQELETAAKCRKSLNDSFGLDDNNRQWLARLLTRRRIVVVPTANALGYFLDDRYENGFDPNRDFPYDSDKDCMNTIAARTVNEIYRQHLFQMSLTFHAGTELIGYEWGAFEWVGFNSPDDIGQNRVARALSRFAGSVPGSQPYKYGDMNDIIYAVNGGMEDWAYAGSFDPDRVIPCEPTTYGGYPRTKTIYSNSTLRSFNILVETSFNKIPAANTLGSSLHILNPEGLGNGHVPRNVRLAILAADLVEPYLSIEMVNKTKIVDDVVPLASQGGASCSNNHRVSVPYDSKRLTIEWAVGGALVVNQTRLWFTKWKDNSFSTLDCVRQPDINEIKKEFTVASAVGPSSGYGRFSDSGPTRFSAVLDLSKFKAGDKLVVIASARVDQLWTVKSDKTAPDLSPQSHIVNARTNPNWYHKNSNGRVVQGRLDWFSNPVTIVLSPYGIDRGIPAVQVSNRFACLTEKQLFTLSNKPLWFRTQVKWEKFVDGSATCSLVRNFLTR